MSPPQGHLNKPGKIETNRVKRIGIRNGIRKAFNKSMSRKAVEFNLKV